MSLTILSDKSNATVQYNGDAIFAQLLVAERPAICAGSQRDRRVPQRKVHSVEAVDVNCSVRPKKRFVIVTDKCQRPKAVHNVRKCNAKSFDKHPTRLNSFKRASKKTHLKRSSSVSLQFFF